MPKPLTHSDHLRPADASAHLATFRGIQAVRGLAAGMVVLFHSTQFWSIAATGGANTGIWFNGAGGVDIFFIVSGFVMAISTLDKDRGPAAAWRFLERRIVRIFPLYWIVTALLLLHLAFDRLFKPTHPPMEITLPYFLASLALIPWRDHLGSTAPVLAPGWTLTYEMLFYLCFAAALALRFKVIRSLTLLFGALALLSFVRVSTWPPVLQLCDPLLLEFVAGLWIAIAVKSGRRIPPVPAALLGGSALIAILTLPHPATELFERLEWGSLGLVIVFAAIMLEGSVGNRIPRWVLFLGDASYSLYLSHYLLISGIAKLLTRTLRVKFGVADLASELICLAVSLIVSVAVAAALYLAVERPINKKLRRRLGLRRQRTLDTFSAG